MPGDRVLARKPLSQPVLKDLLIYTLKNAWDLSTCRAYQSHLKAYLHFVRVHKFDPQPNETTLALFIVYMNQYIKPSSIESYLTGIGHYLTPIYPQFAEWRSAQIVRQALLGCKKLNNTPIRRKTALSLSDLSRIVSHYDRSRNHDDLLFVAILLVGFFALLRLGELVCPNDPSLDSPRKLTQ